MKTGRASDTAAAVAAARALGPYIYENATILDDPFAKNFLGFPYSVLHWLFLHFRFRPLALGCAAIYDRLLPGAIGWILTRHRYFDDAVDEAVNHGIAQVVLVGAGYDSRALRQQALSGIKIFEVDHPDTQARKKRIVRELFGEMPKHVVYVGMEASRADLRQLTDYGFDRSATTIFLLEGFLWYMRPDVAHAILAAVAELGAPGSRVIFDHILPSVVDGSCRLAGAREHRRYCARRGEPILFGIEPDRLASYLSELGMRLVEDVGHATLSARYLAAGQRKIGVYPFMGIATAIVESGNAR